jgi:hypothetical protein
VGPRTSVEITGEGEEVTRRPSELLNRAEKR